MFRFTIRELVLVTVIVALGLGWWLDRRGVADLQQRIAVLQKRDHLRELDRDYLRRSNFVVAN